MPFADDPDFEKLVIEVCKKHRIDLVVPKTNWPPPSNRGGDARGRTRLLYDVGRP